MKTDAIIKKIKEIPGGRFFRVRYISKVKMAADALKEGVTIFKIVDTTTRTGVKYDKIARVVASLTNKKEEPIESGWEWIVKDRLKHNKNTGKDYLVLAPIGKGAHSVHTYIMTDAEGNTSVVDEETVKMYTVPSYWRDDSPSIINVTLDNVLLVR